MSTEAVTNAYSRGQRDHILSQQLNGHGAGWSEEQGKVKRRSWMRWSYHPFYQRHHLKQQREQKTYKGRKNSNHRIKQKGTKKKTNQREKREIKRIVNKIRKKKVQEKQEKKKSALVTSHLFKREPCRWRDKRYKRAQRTSTQSGGEWAGSRGRGQRRGVIFYSSNREVSSVCACWLPALPH